MINIFERFGAIHNKDTNETDLIKIYVPRRIQNKHLKNENGTTEAA